MQHGANTRKERFDCTTAPRGQSSRGTWGRTTHVRRQINASSHSSLTTARQRDPGLRAHASIVVLPHSSFRASSAELFPSAHPFLLPLPHTGSR